MVNFNFEPKRTPVSWLRRVWSWLSDAHLELPEEREEVRDSEQPLIAGEPPAVPVAALPAGELDWQRKIRLFNEEIDKKKEARIG